MDNTVEKECTNCLYNNEGECLASEGDCDPGYFQLWKPIRDEQQKTTDLDLQRLFLDNIGNLLSSDDLRGFLVGGIVSNSCFLSDKKTQLDTTNRILHLSTKLRDVIVQQEKLRGA